MREGEGGRERGGCRGARVTMRKTIDSADGIARKGRKKERRKKTTKKIKTKNTGKNDQKQLRKTEYATVTQ